ncbi:MAG: ATP-binding domain-containing protein, partial [Kurthia sp.]|nr:ATP-binding domain-containing protein [Kurthia sp.]
AQNSMIVVNAHRVNRGEFPTTRLPDAKKDFVYIKELLAENTPKHLQSIYQNALKRCKIPQDRAIVLTPMNRGAAGTIKLNYDLQQQLNPDTNKPQLQHSGTTYKVGDRVMQIRNNYDKIVFNGDIGDVTAVDTSERTISVNFLGHLVTYEYSELDELVLAYAVSIHKSQGSEYDAVIIPLFTQHFILLQRNLVYTAITRAKKLCIIVGDPRAIAMAIHNTKGNDRLTFLKEFLTTDLACR